MWVTVEFLLGMQGLFAHAGDTKKENCDHERFSKYGIWETVA